MEEMKACTADKECGMLHAKFLHYKLQEANKAGGYGSKGGDGNEHDKKPKEYGQDGEKKGSESSYGGKGGDGGYGDQKLKEYGQDGEKKGSESYGGKSGDGGYGDKKPKQYGGNNSNFAGQGGFGKKRRQLDGHVKTSDKDGEEKASINEKDMGKKDMGGKGGEEKEPSAEFKAAAKACTENELCKNLMECKTKHKESGGKGDHGCFVIRAPPET